MNKKILIILFVFMLAYCTAFADEQQFITVILDNNIITYDVQPQIINGRTMVPLRATFEALGIEVGWDNTTKKITGHKGEVTIELIVEQSIAYINNNQVILDSPAIIVNGRTLVPIRFIAEAAGAEVQWDNVAKQVLIYTNQTSIPEVSELTEQEKTLLSSVGFDKEIFQLLKDNFNSPIAEFTIDYYDNSFENGVYVTTTDRDFAYDTVLSLSEEFMEKGYGIFIYDLRFNSDLYKVGIIKSNDKYDPLRFMGTNGINYDHTTDDVVDQLKEWDALYEIDIVCAGPDFVEVKLNKMPSRINQFAEEVYQFCPDSVEQGTGTIEALADETKNTSFVFMWWD